MEAMEILVDPLIQSVMSDGAWTDSDKVRAEISAYAANSNGQGVRTLDYRVAAVIQELYYLHARLDGVLRRMEMRAKADYSVRYLAARQKEAAVPTRTGYTGIDDAKETARASQRSADQSMASLTAARAMVMSRIKGLERVSGSLHAALFSLTGELKHLGA